MTEFTKAVERVVRAIPKGKTLGYSQVALLAGKPGAARAVAKSMNASIPWWRVLKSDGTVAEPMLSVQGPKLKAEGVVLTGRRVPKTARASIDEVGARLSARTR